MEHPDWMNAGLDSASARFLMLTATTHHRFSSPAPARELALAYHQRREHEGGNAQLETSLRGPGKVLRSQSPALAEQEIWVRHGSASTYRYRPMTLA
jgi:hypothetical protein